MSRRATVILVSTLVVLIVAGAGLWAALPRIAENVIVSRLNALGLGPVEATVSHVDLSGARLERLTAGGGALTIDGAEVTWRAQALAPEAIIIDSLRLTGRWTAENGLSLGPLDALLAGGGESTAPEALTLPVPRVVIRDARAAIALPEGTLTATAEGTITRAQPGPALDITAKVDAPGLAGRLSFKGTAAGAGATPVSGDGHVSLTATGFTAPGVAGSVNGSVNAAVGIGADTVTLATESPITLTLHDLAPALAEALAEVMPEDAGEDPPLHLTLAGPQSGAPRLTVSGLDDPATLAVASDGLRLTAARGAALVSATAAGSLRLEDGLPTAVLHDLSASAEGVTVAGVPLDAGLANADATLSAAGIAAEGDVTIQAGAADIGDVTADSAALQTRLRLTTEADGTGALYAASGSLRVEGLKPAPDLTLMDPVTLVLTETEAPLVRLRRAEDGSGLEALVRATFADPGIRLRQDSTAIRAVFRRLGLDAALRLPANAAPSLETATLTGTGGTLERDDDKLTDATLTAALTAEGPRLDLTGHLDRLPGEPAEVASRSPLRPYHLSLTAASAPDAGDTGRMTVDLDLRDAAQARLASATGWADLTAGTGRLRLDVPRQVFDPDALRPEHLHGSLGTFASGVTGAVAAEGTVAWGPDGLRPDLDLLLRDLSLTQGFVTLRRINGVIRLTGVDPLRTPLGQTVSVAAIEAGLPLTNVTADFQVDGDRLHIDSARATLADGTLTADPATIPIDLSTGTMTLRVRDMRLAPLVDLLAINGLDADGALGGEIPLQFAGGDVLINNAVLRSQGPDRVAYAPDEPPDALSGGGESVGMVMEALEDFRYSTLRLTVDGRASGELTVTLHIAGHNPTFYDGYPVEFNLSVSGALAQAVQAGLQGYQVPNRIRERMLDFQND